MQIARLALITTASAALITGLCATASPAGATALAKNAQSADMGGYEVTGGTATGSVAHFRLPSFTCPSTGSQAVTLWLGLASAPVSNLSTPPASYAIGGLFLKCDSGAASYVAFAAINGDLLNTGPVNPAANDMMSVSASQTADRAKVIVRDLTQKTQDVFRGTPGSNGGTDVSADFGVMPLSNGALEPVPAFGSIKFTHVTYTGAGSTFTPYDMAINGTPTVHTGPLNAAGNAFAMKVV